MPSFWWILFFLNWTEAVSFKSWLSRNHRHQESEFTPGPTPGSGPGSTPGSGPTALDQLPTCLIHRILTQPQMTLDEGITFSQVSRQARQSVDLLPAYLQNHDPNHHEPKIQSILKSSCKDTHLLHSILRQQSLYAHQEPFLKLFPPRREGEVSRLVACLGALREVVRLQRRTRRREQGQEEGPWIKPVRWTLYQWSLEKLHEFMEAIDAYPDHHDPNPENQQHRRDLDKEEDTSPLPLLGDWIHLELILISHTITDTTIPPTQFRTLHRLHGGEVSSLKHIAWRYIRGEGQGWRALWRAMGRNPFLESVEMRSCRVGAGELGAWADALEARTQSPSTRREAQETTNDDEDENDAGGQDANREQSQMHLRTLELSWSALRKDALPHLARLLRHTPELRTLRLNENLLDTDSLWGVLDVVGRWVPRLRTLDLSWNRAPSPIRLVHPLAQDPSSSLPAAAEHAHFQLPTPADHHGILHRLLVQNTHLRHVNMAGLPLTPFMDALVHHLPLSGVRTLDISGTKMTGMEVAMVLRAMREMRGLREVKVGSLDLSAVDPFTNDEEEKEDPSSGGPLRGGEGPDRQSVPVEKSLFKYILALLDPDAPCRLRSLDLRYTHLKGPHLLHLVQRLLPPGSLHDASLEQNHSRHPTPPTGTTNPTTASSTTTHPRLSTLHTLILSGNHFPHPSLPPLLHHYLAHPSTTLQTLHLESNDPPLADHGAFLLAKGLERNRVMRRVVLGVRAGMSWVGRGVLERALEVQVGVRRGLERAEMERMGWFGESSVRASGSEANPNSSPSGAMRVGWRNKRKESDRNRNRGVVAAGVERRKVHPCELTVHCAPRPTPWSHVRAGWRACWTSVRMGVLPAGLYARMNDGNVVDQQDGEGV